MFEYSLMLKSIWLIYNLRVYTSIYLSITLTEECPPITIVVKMYAKLSFKVFFPDLFIIVIPS